FLQVDPPHLHPPSFPTRRSSDLPSTLQRETPSALFSSASFAVSRYRISPYPRWPSRPSPLPAPDRTRRDRPRREHCLPYSTRSRSEEHTSELQSRGHLVCRLLLE